MASRLEPIAITAPGYAGLNTQDSALSLSKDFALVAENAVIDKNGRIAARRGWAKVNTSSGFNSEEPSLIHEIVKADGSTVICSIGDKKIFTGTTTLTQVYADATWTAQTGKQLTLIVIRISFNVVMIHLCMIMLVIHGKRCQHTLPIQVLFH